MSEEFLKKTPYEAKQLTVMVMNDKNHINKTRAGAQKCLAKQDHLNLDKRERPFNHHFQQIVLVKIWNLNAHTLLEGTGDGTLGSPGSFLDLNSAFLLHKRHKRKKRQSHKNLNTDVHNGYIHNC